METDLDMKNRDITQSGRQGLLPQRGFTLLEALIASVIMALTVTAVAMALGSGRQYSVESMDQMQASLAAEALMSEILALDYANYDTYDGRDDLPGTMLTFAGNAFPDSFYRIGRRAAVAVITKSIPGFGVDIKGKEIAVEAYDTTDRVLATLVIFVAEPVP